MSHSIVNPLFIFFQLVKLQEHGEETLLISANKTTIHVIGSNKGKTFLSQDQGLAIRFHKFCYGNYCSLVRFIWSGSVSWGYRGGDPSPLLPIKILKS